VLNETWATLQYLFTDVIQLQCKQFTHILVTIKGQGRDLLEWSNTNNDTCKMCTYHKPNPNLTQKTIAYLVGRLKHKEKVQAPW